MLLSKIKKKFCQQSFFDKNNFFANNQIVVKHIFVWSKSKILVKMKILVKNENFWQKNKNKFLAKFTHSPGGA